MTKINKACEAYKIFDAFKITENMNISDYILEFDKPYNKAKKYEMALPEAILAFKILDNAGLSSHEKQLDLTACTDLQYKSMKSALHEFLVKILVLIRMLKLILKSLQSNRSPVSAHKTRK